MTQSVKNLKQERDRLVQMHRSMPDSKDQNAREVAARIKSLDTRIAAEQNGSPSEKTEKKGGVSAALLLCLAVAIAFLAFAVSYLVGSQY